MNAIRCECDGERKEALVKLNACRGNVVSGIDFVKTVYGKKESLIDLHFTGEPTSLRAENIVIRHRRRQRELDVIKLYVTGNIAKITVTGAEPRETYDLRLVELEDGLRTHCVWSKVDPRFSEIDFEFYESGARHTDVDPKQPHHYGETSTDLKLSYLARDYGSFLGVLYDRLAQTMPKWRERRAADGFVTSIELMAFVADRLSYFQDAVATESYLHTARQRVSVRRHAHLVDYRIHEGCNSRSFLHVHVSQDVEFEPSEIYFITTPPEKYQLEGSNFSRYEIPDELHNDVVVFEPVGEPQLDDQQRVQRAAIEPADVKDRAELARVLCDPANVLTEKMRGALSADLHARLKQCDESAITGLSDRTLAKILTDINGVIRDDDLLEAGRNDPLLESAYRTTRNRFADAPRAIVNRALVDAVFEHLVSPARFSDRIRLISSLNEIEIYTWGEEECRLPAGTTSATLLDGDLKPNAAPCASSKRQTPTRKLDRLNRGDFLLLEEVRGPSTGNTDDADSARRQVVRLTRVERGSDPVTGQNVVLVQWRDEDALTFDLCVSTRRDVPYCDIIDKVSVARGNIVLVDQGRTINNEELDAVEGRWVQTGCGSSWSEPTWSQQRRFYRPVVKEPALIHTRLPKSDESASEVLDQSKRCESIPSITLTGIPAVPASDPPVSLPLRPQDLMRPQQLLRLIRSWGDDASRRQLLHVIEDQLPRSTNHKLNEIGANPDPGELEAFAIHLASVLREKTTWLPAQDLIDHAGYDQNFVAEVDNERRVHLRFGDNRHGRRPDVGTRFFATYRVGNGTSGNVGADSISVIVTRGPSATAVSQVRNPVPAAGGQDPESLQEVKLYAPHEYRNVPLRAVLADDYADLVKREFSSKVQNASASISWAGTHWLVEVAVDPLASSGEFEPLRRAIEAKLQVYRRMGHRVQVGQGKNVPLDLHATVCVAPGYARSEVRLAIIDLYSSRVQADGTPGLFHPDQRTFGQPVYVSKLVAAASRIQGVENVVITRLARLRGGPNVAARDVKENDGGADEEREARGSNVLAMGPLEIAQLENSNREETGRFCLTITGGR